MRLLVGSVLMGVLGLAIAESALEDYYPSHGDTVRQRGASFRDILLPHKSAFIPGKVTPHYVDIPPQYCFYIVSDDKSSIDWLTTNHHFLKRKNCIGIITNIHEMDALRGLEKQFDTVFFPVNLDGFEKILKTTHYPLAVYEGRAVQ